MSEATVELASFFEAERIDADQCHAYASAAYATYQDLERFDRLVREYEERVEQGEGEAMRLALGYQILGKYEQAAAWFRKSPDGAERRFRTAGALMSLGRFEEALEELSQALSRGWDGFAVEMQVAEIELRRRNMEAARKLVEKHETAGQDRAEWYLVRGLLREIENDREGALDDYERALKLSPDDEQAMFRAARMFDLCGEDYEAIALYEALAEQPRAFVNALINLAVIYEDRGRFDEAGDCLHRVLKRYPNHTRARLYMKDVESCQEMVIDDGRHEVIDSRKLLLEAPIGDLELSVRARNCLKKMKVDTLGDLLKLNEAELLAYKNFGETSLSEIRALLEKRGLHLGQSPEEIPMAGVAEPAAPRVEVPPEQEAVLSKPVADLELSVRSRRCLQRLDIQTLGDLIHHTEADLLAARNFGVTSLNEIKQRLATMGLELSQK